MLRLLPTEAGGRAHPIRSDFRPNHNFGSAERRDFHIGRIMLPDGRELRPGESGEAIVDFLDKTGLALAPGLEWRIQEGGRLIAMATVIELLP